MFFHYSITYAGTDNQDWLSKVVTSSQFIEINFAAWTTFIVHKIMPCIASTMVGLVVVASTIVGLVLKVTKVTIVGVDRD